ncbi:MAG: PQQ-binding-like beta-propeller repeat protein [Verrucomicrobiota bacterium]
MNFPDNAIYAAFNGRVFALDRRDGRILWRWQPTKGGNFVTLLPDGDQLLVCSDGYLWALRAEDGAVLWSQPFKGEGTGIPVLASPRSPIQSPDLGSQISAIAAEEARRQQSAATHASSAT